MQNSLPHQSLAKKARLPSDKIKWLCLLALTTMNLVNYVDRYVLTSLLPEIQAELAMSDSQAGLLGTAFMVVYFVCSPLFGWLGDLGARPNLLGSGVIFWSMATASAGLTSSFGTLFAARAAVGMGEAAYGSIAPSLITDWFDRRLHGRALSFFYLATPVGSALGYLLGGVLGARLGWRPAFFVVGLPGVLLALTAFMMRDPLRQQSAWRVLRQGQANQSGGTSVKTVLGRMKKTYGTLLKNRLYVGTVLGYTAYTFALGGFAFWAPSYMMRVRGFSQESGMLTFGGITVVTGTVGTLLGGLIGDWLKRYTRNAYTWVGVMAMMLGSVATASSLFVSDNTWFLITLVAAELFLFLNTGPVNAIIVGSVPRSIRGSAMATSIFCIHLFGDAISPVILGRISDASTLTTAMATIPIIFVLAAVIWLISMPRHPSRDTLADVG